MTNTDRLTGRFGVWWIPDTGLSDQRKVAKCVLSFVLGAKSCQTTFTSDLEFLIGHRIKYY